MLLTPTQARVVGSLIEKEMTTPQYYPLTLKALVTACNQSNNRDPVMTLRESQVSDALEALREKQLIRVVHPSHGGRSIKYRHVIDETWRLDAAEQALVGLLLLRGPQTLGELRSRSERMQPMATLDEVEACLRALAGREEPLVVLLGRQPGQKEPRWTELVSAGAGTGAAAGEAPAGPGFVTSRAAPVATSGAPAPELPLAPRIPPLDPDDMDDQQLELVAGIGRSPGGASNIFLTLARHPGLMRRWLPFGGKILAGKLPARDRELLILRTAWRCQAAYEWGHHVAIGREAGLTEDEVARVPDGPSAFGDDDAVLLRAADELHDHAVISDAIWKVLSERYDERQLIEVPMTVGQYHLVSFTLNSLGIQPEEGVAALPRPPGAT